MGNVVCAYECNIYSTVGWCIFYISTKISWLVIITQIIYIHIYFSVLDLLITEKECWNLLLQMWISLSLCKFYICFLYFKALLLDACTFRIVVHLVKWPLRNYVVALFIHVNVACFEVYMSDINICILDFFPFLNFWKQLYECVWMAESLCCTPEAVTTVLIDYTPK